MGLPDDRLVNIFRIGTGDLERRIEQLPAIFQDDLFTQELTAAFDSVQRTARASFGDARVYLGAREDALLGLLAEQRGHEVGRPHVARRGL